MKVLNIEQLLFLHFSIIEATGGSHGLRDLGLLKAAVARPWAGFGEVEFYPEIYDKAAVLTHSIINNHPFIDGNKRTGIAAGVLTLKINNINFKVDQEEMVRFVMQIAQGQVDWPQIAKWFRRHSCISR
ncbi:type II toxin-antitoxin system death-on-curing family toxin [Carboxydocella sp. JDF658]|uniref:type II toxin-antitoxin system death-on-curing family toxin n=1 Tax=Carboxydocella sp. JDF658 TaxID=1926600 RepID=UPI0009AED2CF|nr:type II toxin-antitoxin system death-on-curing family toxin [Carboxydocella sp. JDF658]GAW30263.1 prophage maintenance system killer protein [Carboxydocella sp. JDF658]